jgi:hypothetical protein
MGADLYINSLFESHHAEWERTFEAALKLREELADGGAAREQAQDEVSRCYEEMYSRGYFRDSYNDFDLLWQFKLSWWKDVIPLLDEHGRLSVSATRRLLKLLDMRQSIFDERLDELSADAQECFCKKRVRFRNFLNQAIALNEPIDCSL